MNPTRSDMARLDHLLAHSEELNSKALKELAPPPLLAQYFLLKQYIQLRQGPTTDCPPASLLKLAEQGAACGALPASTVATLRSNLTQLANDLQAAGAWQASKPLWWQPLPRPGLLESCWNNMERVRLPTQESLRRIFATQGVVLPLLVCTAFLPIPLLRQVSSEITMAWQIGALKLERAGVGSQDQVSSSRTDWVSYLDGHGPQTINSLNVLVQWLQQRMTETLNASLPNKSLRPPGTAMLARYEPGSTGYHPHLDNPDGNHDNGRSLTLTLYLNAPDQNCNGGHLAVWSNNHSLDQAPTLCVPTGGNAMLFDSRTVPHQVLPLESGPARWALTLWFNDGTDKPSPPTLPTPGISDLLLAITDPPMAAKKVAFHQLPDALPAGQISIFTRKTRPRCGLVATVYRGKAHLEQWCHDHLDAGLDHILLIFDHLEEPEESACADALLRHFPADVLTIWSGEQTALKRWPLLPQDARLEKPKRIARLGGSSQAVAARQMLGASAALDAARNGELGTKLDWLVHLDADEWLYPEGAGRGGACLADCFSAAHEAGFKLLRFANHELLHELGAPRPRFKINPKLAVARLGSVGWQEVVRLLKLENSGRHWFNGYFNGKGAVATAHGHLAAGVHGWYLQQTPTPAENVFLAGPHVLHFHIASAEAFRQKYLRIAAAPIPEEERLFQPSPVEEAALDLIAKAKRENATELDLNSRLNAFHAGLDHFTASQLELLEEARLLWTPNKF